MTVVQDLGVAPKAAELFYGPDGRERGFRVVWQPQVVTEPYTRLQELYKLMARGEIEAWYALESCNIISPEGERQRGKKLGCIYLLPNGNGTQGTLFPVDPTDDAETVLASKASSPAVSVLEPEFSEPIQTKFLRGTHKESKDTDFYVDTKKRVVAGSAAKKVKVCVVPEGKIFDLEYMAKLHVGWIEQGYTGNAPVLLLNPWRRELSEEELWRLYHVSRLRSYEGCLGVVVLTPNVSWGIQPTSMGAGPPQVLYPDEKGAVGFSHRRIVFRVGNQAAFIYDEGQEQRFRERYPRWIRAMLNREHGWRG